MQTTLTVSKRSSRQRPMLAGVAILGLLGALLGVAAPVFADHGGATLVTSFGSQPNPCADIAGATGYKLDGNFPAMVEEEPGVFVPDESFHTYTYEDGEGNVLFSIDVAFFYAEDDTQPTSLQFANAAPAITRVTIKAGSDQSTEDPQEHWDFPAGATAGSAGPRTDGKDISWVGFCVGGETTGGGTSTPTVVPTTTPTLGTDTTASPSGTGGELGGQGTPRGGGVPNTAAEPVSIGQIVTLLSVLLVVGSVAALLMPILAQRTNR